MNEEHPEQSGFRPMSNEVTPSDEKLHQIPTRIREILQSYEALSSEHRRRESDVREIFEYAKQLHSVLRSISQIPSEYGNKLMGSDERHRIMKEHDIIMKRVAQMRKEWSNVGSELSDAGSVNQSDHHTDSLDESTLSVPNDNDDSYSTDKDTFRPDDGETDERSNSTDSNELSPTDTTPRISQTSDNSSTEEVHQPFTEQRPSPKHSRSISRPIPPSQPTANNITIIPPLTHAHRIRTTSNNRRVKLRLVERDADGGTVPVQIHEGVPTRHPKHRTSMVGGGRTGRFHSHTNYDTKGLYNNSMHTNPHYEHRRKGHLQMNGIVRVRHRNNTNHLVQSIHYRNV